MSQRLSKTTRFSYSVRFMRYVLVPRSFVPVNGYCRVSLSVCQNDSVSVNF
jgi:hypothetical protein